MTDIQRGRMSYDGLHRSITQGGHVRAVETDGAPGVRLQIIKYNVVDDYGSVWAPGCLIEGLYQRLPQLAWNHDRSQVIGRAVKEFSDDGEGQQVQFRFANFEKVPLAGQIYSLITDGIVDECSVGFRWEYEYRTPTDEDKERWPGVREVITKAFVSEVSIVMEGAVPEAKVLTVRSRLLGARAPMMVDAEVAAEIVTQMKSGDMDLLTGLQAINDASVPAADVSVELDDSANATHEKTNELETENKPTEKLEAQGASNVGAVSEVVEAEPVEPEEKPVEAPKEGTEPGVKPEVSEPDAKPQLEGEGDKVESEPNSEVEGDKKTEVELESFAPDEFDDVEALLADREVA